jgi:biopolymer transport protein ExbD
MIALPSNAKRQAKAATGRIQGAPMIDIILFVVISFGIAVSLLYIFGALRSRRATRM